MRVLLPFLQHGSGDENAAGPDRSGAADKIGGGGVCSCYVQVMAPSDAQGPHGRHQRLRDLSRTPDGYIQVARCQDCGHLAALPLAALLQRFGELTPVQQIRDRITCSACRSRATEIRMMRLCDPGCPRQRG